MPPLRDATSPVEQRLAAYFDQLGTALWDSRQRHCFASYAIGLMSELERKSLEPAASLADDPKAAERLHHRLQNFVADAPWPDAQVRRIAARYALSAMQKRAPIQTWICDDTSFPKSGDHSVGVQRQYCGALGKVANCQAAPSLKVATPYAHLLLDMTLYLGPKWADDPERRKEARIPDEVQFKTKPKLMLDHIKLARRNGIPPGVVLGDSAFGNDRTFRQGVREQQLHYILGVHLTTSVCRIGKDGAGAPQRIEQILSALPPSAFRRYHLRRGSRGPLSARFAFLRVQVPQDEIDKSLWLILEWRDDEESPSRAHLSSLPPTTSRTRLIYLMRERYRTEQVYRECKQELGLDRYEGRKWRGFEHHVTVVLCCYAFLVAELEGAFPPSRYKRELARRAELQSAPPGANG
ncbi:MAG: IS701 family transposase [Polyangia bacterium]